jgi:hypothetical protein
MLETTNNTIETVETENTTIINNNDVILDFDMKAEKIKAETIGSDRKEVFQDILFNIKEMPVFVQVDNNMLSVAGQKALVNTQNNKVLSIVSDRYKPVNNDIVLDRFSNLLNSNGIEFKYGRGTLNRSGNKSIMELILPNNEINIKGDRMTIRAYLINDFMGTGAVKLQLGHFRHKCMNLALIQGTKEVDFKASHVGLIHDKLDNQFSDYIFKQMNEAKNFLTDLTQGNFKDNKEVLDFFEKTEIVAERYAKSLTDTWLRNYQGSLSYHGIYNTFTDVLTHSVRGNDLTKMSAHNKLNFEFAKLLKKNPILDSSDIIEAELD